MASDVHGSASISEASASTSPVAIRASLVIDFANGALFKVTSDLDSELDLWFSGRAECDLSSRVSESWSADRCTTLGS